MTAKTKPAVKSAAKKPAAKKKRPGVGAWVRSFFTDKRAKNMTNAEIAEIARQKFGGKTSPACISWYRANPA
jgi:hypothetical protein